MRATVVVIGILLAVTSCGNGDNGRTQANGLRTTTYRLAPAQGPYDPNGSVIAFAALGMAKPPPPPSPLSGTFDLRPVQPLPPKTDFDFLITNVQLNGGPYTVLGNTGRVTAARSDTEHPLSIAISVSINGQQVELVGSGSPDTFTGDSPPVFTGVVLLDDTLGYSITLFAAPAE
jgi:hypothetical protein